MQKETNDFEFTQFKFIFFEITKRLKDEHKRVKNLIFIMHNLGDLNVIKL